VLRLTVRCLLRGLPLLFAASPRTPLRVLCIVALDTVQVHRRGCPLSRQTREELAAFLDFQACTNAAWDGKRLCMEEYQALRQRLEKAGLGVWILDYLSRIRELETQRPSIGGDRDRFDEVRTYREEVARLALATVAAIAFDSDSIAEGIRATYDDGDVAMLFRMAMQCQIIDDVVDYRDDRSAGLPSFLTAALPLSQAVALTACAAGSYQACPERMSDRGALPLRIGLWVLTRIAILAVRACHAISRAQGPSEPSVGVISHRRFQTVRRRVSR
jgi:hypothetical protein